jgi:outer membrane immunogenic protein
MLAIAAAITPASAADMYRPEAPASMKDAPAYVPANTWTGFYIGANGGYGWSAHSKLNLSGTDIDTCNNQDCTLSDKTSKDLNPAGGFGGGQIGYNWQHGRLVYGIEADLQGAGIRKSVNAVVLPGDATDSASASSALDWFGTVRGRLGYSFDRTLVYATGGFAFGGVKDHLTVTDADGNVAKDFKDKTVTGFAVGGGIEYALSPAWSLKGEYQFLDLGSSNLSASPNPGPNGSDDTANGSLKVDHSYHTVRIGLNYHVGDSYEPMK